MHKRDIAHCGYKDVKKFINAYIEKTKSSQRLNQSNAIIFYFTYYE